MTPPFRLSLSTAAALSLVIPGAQAQATPDAVLPPVQVVGSPVVEAQRVDAFASLATEVSEAQVRDLNALDLSSALRRTPGVTVSRFNPVGSFGGDEGGAVYVRGMGASRPGSEIKTFVDGIPFYMGVWNHSLLDLLPVNGMQGISVLKGPQPQRFGNTFAAIELTPKRAVREGLGGQLRLTAGSFSTVTEQAELSWRHDGTELLLAQGAARSDGHRDTADGRLSNLMINASQRLDAHWRLGLLLLGADNRASDPGEEGAPASRTGSFDTRGALTALSLEHRHAGSQGRLQLYSNHGDSDWANPNAALTFYWPEFERQVCVAGRVTKVPREESAAYFHSRPRGSQIGAWASRQSSVVESRAELEKAWAELEKKFPTDIPLPPTWGGYVLQPDRIEFWQGRPSRLHDRLCYQRQTDGNWRIERLSP